MGRDLAVLIDGHSPGSFASVILGLFNMYKVHRWESRSAPGYFERNVNMSPFSSAEGPRGLFLRVGCILAVVFLFSASLRAEIIADSVDDWSVAGEQGERNWYSA